MSRSGSAFAPAFHFQRGEAKPLARRRTRRVPVETRRVLLALGIAAFGLFAARESYLFVVSWEKLAVRKVELACPDEAVSAGVSQSLRDIRWGNILLLDVSEVRRRIEANPWVKSATIRKTFPSSVQVSIAVRTPAAIVKKANGVLIDGAGVELGPAGPEAYARLPLLADADGFRTGAADKISLAGKCLEAMTPEERADAEILDLSDVSDVILKFRSRPTRMKLGDESFGERIGLFRKMGDSWENEFGPLEYVDLRFSDRIYVKAAGAVPSEEGRPASDKEKL